MEQQGYGATRTRARSLLPAPQLHSIQFQRNQVQCSSPSARAPAYILHPRASAKCHLSTARASINALLQRARARSLATSPLFLSSSVHSPSKRTSRGSDGARGAHRSCVTHTRTHTHCATRGHAQRSASLLKKNNNKKKQSYCLILEEENTPANVIRDEFILFLRKHPESGNSTPGSRVGVSLALRLQIEEMLSPLASILLHVFCLSGLGRCTDSPLSIQHFIQGSVVCVCVFVLLCLVLFVGFWIEFICA